MARRRRRSRSGININPAHRGAFTRKGISVSQGLRSSNPRTRAQANFARMARRGWKPLGKSSGSSTTRRRRRSSTARTHHVHSHTRIVRGRRVRVRAHRRRNPRRR
jgi:hypothetical protein